MSDPPEGESESLEIDGTAVALHEGALLLTGRSGSGKSDLALRLIDAGARLISDDRVRLIRREARLWCRAPRDMPPALHGRIEARGVGIIPVPVAGHLRLASYPGAHAVPSAALRFSTDEESVTFSSDTGTCAALIEAARQTSLFLCEATYLDASPAELQHHGHLTPQLAAMTAADAGARRLVLTHLGRPADAPTAIATASHHFHTAPVTVATSGTTITVAPAVGALRTLVPR